METAYSVVLTTAASREDAREIAEKVLREKLAACVQLVPIESFYTWKGEVAREDEILLLLKTREALYPELESAIIAMHKYRTPEIVLLPVDNGSAAYLAWIDEVT